MKKIVGKKECWKCKEVKDLNDYYNDKSRPDGKAYHCKNCIRLYLQQYRQSDKFKAYARRKAKVWSGANPEKVKAHRIARRYKTELKRDACEKCGKVEGLEMHHPDYTKPQYVLTLCVRCHKLEHHGKLSYAV